MERDYYAELAQLRAWAERVKARLANLAPPANPLARRELAASVKLADELAERAVEPITIGMVGEFTVGKSRLLNSVLKQPGLLPVSGPPTTGNITALRVFPAGPGEAPGLRHAWVSYMSRRELSRLAGFILGELTSVINRHRLNYPISALVNYDPVTAGWDRFENLARKWWEPGQPDGTVNKEVRLYAWELLRLRNAQLIGRELIPERGSGRPIEVDKDLVQEAIRIGDTREVPDRFPERPARRPVRSDARLTAAVLRDTFPVIRRLTYDVVIEPGLLALGGLRESNGLELLDFAGLQAMGGARDEYLCGRELERITGYLEVVNAVHAETMTAVRFGSMLEGRRRSRAHLADSAMLVANMFDLVPPAPPRATVTELGATSEEVGSLLRLAKLVSPNLDRLALTSAVVEQGDPRWLTVADALYASTDDSAESQLAKALRAYAADGGIARLRDLISEYIATLALPVMVDELKALRAELETVLVRLRALIDPPAAAADGTKDTAVLGDLVVGLLGMVLDARKSAAAFRDADRITVASVDAPVTAAGAGAVTAATPGLLDRIEQEAVVSVYAWPVWNALFGAYAQGEIRMPSSQGGSAGDGASARDSDPAGPGEPDYATRWDIGADDEDEDEDDWRDRTQATIQLAKRHADADGGTTLTVQVPGSTDDFLAPFDDSLGKLRKVARDLALHVVEEWVASLHGRHAALRDRLADPAARSMLAERLAELDPDGGTDRLRRLEKIADLSWVTDDFDRFLTRIQGRAARDGANAFPLAPNHALPWHPRIEEIVPEGEDLSTRRHHSKAQRLRHDLAEGLAFPVQTAVAMAFGSVEAELASVLAQLQGQVPNQAALLAATPAPASADGPGRVRAVGLLDDLIDGSHTGPPDDNHTRPDEEHR